MPESLFNVLFSGKLSGTATPAEARRAIQALFRLADADIDRLFSGHRVTVKRAVDLATARRFQSAFHEAGAIAELEPLDEPETIFAAPPPEDDEESADAHPAGAAAPPPLGLDDAPETATGAGLALAPAGAPLDEIDDRGPPQHPDTSRLSLVLDDDWTLEDCVPPFEPAALPDTDALTLEPMEPRPAPTHRDDH
jgi:hypothetical protein